MRILIICSANSCRSQIAEAFLKGFDSTLEVESAGISPAEKVHPLTVKAMAEIGYDISKSKTTNINEFVKQDWDYVITVCDIDKEVCPVFHGNVKFHSSLKFIDPLSYTGNEEFQYKLIVETREYIKTEITDFYNFFIKNEIT